MNDDDDSSRTRQLSYVPARPVQPLAPKFGMIALLAAILMPVMDMVLARNVPRLRDRGRMGVTAAVGLIALAFALIAIINRGRDRPLAFWAIAVLALVLLVIVIQEM